MQSEAAPALAYIFPGQGSQSVGMGSELSRLEATARLLWEEADDILGFSLSQVAFEGPDVELQRTENAQPALLVAGIVALRVLTARGLLAGPQRLAGHSLGEYTALVAAGSLEYADAVRLVRVRGELMAEQGERVGGAMSAVIGLEPELLAGICAEAGVDIANYNSPEQTVISGEAQAVYRVGERARSAGARRVVPLPVSGAFHSTLMRPLAGSFAGSVDSVPLRPPSFPVVGNVRATPLESVKDIRRELVEQLYSPVRWLQTLRYMSSVGVTQYIELGPGKVLTGLVNRTLTGATAANSDTLLVAAGT